MTLTRLSSELILLGEHCYLSCADEGYFAYLYESEKLSSVRQFIFSLKRCNEAAIKQAVECLASAIPPEWAENYTFVSMPRSSGAANGLQVALQRVSLSDYRDLLFQINDTPASHLGWRPSPIQRSEFLVVNEVLAHPQPSVIVIVDDVLTTGAHFRAAKIVVRERWPNVSVIGLFLSRVCYNNRRYDFGRRELWVA